MKTVTEAKKYYKGDIPATLKGRQKQSCGFKWKYKQYEKNKKRCYTRRNRRKYS